MRPDSGRRALHVGDDAEDEIEDDAVARLEPLGHGLGPDAGDADLLRIVVRVDVVHVERNLAVDADRLHLAQHRLPGSVEHGDAFGYGRFV